MDEQFEVLKTDLVENQLDVVRTGEGNQAEKEI